MSAEMDADCEQTMTMAADIARNRRTVDLRRKQSKVSTADGVCQTINGESVNAVTGHRQTTLLCYMSFVLVISNLAQLRLTISSSQHRHFNVLVGLLLLSLVIQCVIAVYLAYFTKRDLELKLHPMGVNNINRHHNFLFLFLTLVTFVNICVFVLS